MASDPGGRARDPVAVDAPDRHHHHDPVPPEPKETKRNACCAAPADSRPAPAAPPRIPSSDVHAPPRSRIELHRRRSQTLHMSGGESPARGTGIQKAAPRPQDQASLRKHGSSAELYRPGAAAAATRQRMYQILEAAASAENVDLSPISSPTRVMRDKPRSPSTSARPILKPKSRLDVDVDMLDASMPPPPAPRVYRGADNAPSSADGKGVYTPRNNSIATSIDGSTASGSSTSPLESRTDVAPSSSSNATASGSGSLKRSASNSSQTVTIYECPILEVDEKCGPDEDLSWLGDDQELEQMLAMASSHRRQGSSSLAFKRSQEAAMQCSQVVRNVPRMRKRRDRKLDRRRQSLTMSESTICLSASPSPTLAPVA